MDIFGLDYNMNGLAPRGMVAYQVPPYGYIPAHSAALVVIPNGVVGQGGGYLQFGWFTGACCRILNQDSVQVQEFIQLGLVNPILHDTMLRHLAAACGAATPELYQQRSQIGATILSCYQTVGIEDQIFWLRHDAELRRSNMLEYYTSRRDAALNLATSNPSTASDESNQHMMDYVAFTSLLTINKQQLRHVQAVITSLIGHLPREKAVQLAGLCEINVEIAPDGSVLPQNAAPSPPPARQPLAPVSANIQTQAPAPAKENLKRKRQDAAPKKMSEVVDLLDESEDEDTLQSQVNALQAKIAAIRQRTAHEDQVIPSKKPKTISKPVKANIYRTIPPQATSTVHPTAPPKPSVARKVTKMPQQRPPASTPSPFQADPFAPPRSSQNAPMAKEIQRNMPAFQVTSVPSSSSKGTREEVRRFRESMLASVAGKTMGQHWAPRPASRAVVDLTSNSPAKQLAPVGSRQEPAASHASNSEDQSVPRDQPVLCKEQQEVVDCIMAGHNVFYTGSAGCGKSTVLKTFVPLLREKGKTVKIVAPTGKAALDINGSTTWIFAGWTPLHMKRSLQQLLKEAHGRFVRGRLRRTDVLVIDEISMVENHLFARLSAIMKEAREDPRAFGGVQLIVTGDFCQLPPVKPFQYCMHCGREQPQRIVDKDKIVYRCPVHGDCNDEDKWAFRSAAWEECNFKHINLTNIHRQSDEVFIRVLQKLRIGTALTETDRRLLLDHPCDITNAVKLFPTRDQVKRINQTEFDRLTSPKHSYTCLDLFSWNKEKHPHLESKGNRSPYDDSLDALREHRLDTFVEYKKDMLVVLLVNLDIDSGLVNGSQGRIVGFEPLDEAKLPKASRNGIKGGSRMLSDRDRFFSSSQSKRQQRSSSMEPEGRSGDGELRGAYAYLREQQIRQFIENQRNKSKLWPIVEFDNGLKRTIYADCQVNELGDEREYTLLARTQIPLIAAWAMTIHKSQGMTLNRVIVDLGKSFEEGQEYVALSRARSLDGLKVLSLGDGVGKGGNAQVKEFLWRKFKLR